MPASPASSPATTHPVDELLPAPRLIAYGLQHIAAMYAGVVAPPLIIGTAVGLSGSELTLLIGAALLTSGLATLLQTLGVWRIGSRLPFVNGISFAGVAPMLAIVKQSHPGQALPAIYGALLIAGAAAFLAAPWFGRLNRFFPPVVSGTVITLIGLSLFPVAAGWAQGGNPAAADFGSASNIALAGVTLAVVLILNRFLRGFLGSISILLGLAAGTLLAIPLGKSDFGALGRVPVFSMPSPFHFGAPTFQLGAIISMLIVMLVSMTESTADLLALGEIVERPADERVIEGGLRADGAATVLAAVLNGFAATAFAQNIGLIALTKVRSRYVVATSGVILILLGLFPVAGALVSVVPQPVLGGAGLALFGTVTASGVRTLTAARLEESGNLLTVAVALGFGVLPIAAPGFYAHFPQLVQTVMDSGISAGCLVAINLNIFFNQLGRRPAPLVPEVAPEPVGTPTG
ncbi:nucleobase:cation symporter-2 family protein [Streptacidiphilus rugosus]|uniref:nucleobase:cation symporter-2 family protein n=1 Tax=Streptacidiphilus rugosus TaxID=405783 RepID=UPI00055B88C6|nr:nucleobase:cation symporter-2 family protein [Streptacidiphilus rugosus]